MENSRRKVLVGVSGGVDSSVAVLLLKQKGFEVIGVTMKLWRDEDFCTENTSDGVEDARQMCQRLGIEHHVVDLSREFKKYVVDDFVATYADCKTPNPCIECNRHLKFGALMDYADSIGAYYVATGHYARVEYDEGYGRRVIKKSAAGKKDQTYVLYVIEGKKLDRILFPLGDFEDKEQIRRVAEENGLVTARKRDSQEICFIPNNDTPGFIEKYIPQRPGDVVNADGRILGKHNGINRYTIGQRKGMGISSPTPIFVTRLDKAANRVIVGSNEDLFARELEVEDLCWSAVDSLLSEMRCEVKLRYGATPAPATLIPHGSNVKVVLDEPQRAITPGQSAVFYVGDTLIGGGKIAAGQGEK